MNRFALSRTGSAVIVCWLVAVAIGLAMSHRVEAQTTLPVNGATGVDVFSAAQSTTDGLVINQIFGVEYLVIGGGGAGGNAHQFAVAGGGGGAGGVQKYVVGEAGNSGSAPLSVTATLHSITVGAGGIAPVQTDSSTGIGLRGGNGGDSSFLSITGVGGGGGGGAAGGTTSAPSTGGSGGGGSRTTSGISGAAGQPGQGNSGGDGWETNNARRAAGGGGGAGTGGASASEATGGNGGAGIVSVITGGTVSYAGGGGGGASHSNFPAGGTVTPGTAGAGGGNGGAIISGSGAQAGFAAAANRGGGGGGAANTDPTWNSVGRGGSGGSGIVIVRYGGPVLPGLSTSVTSGSGTVTHDDQETQQVYSFTIESSTDSGGFAFDMSNVDLSARLGTTMQGVISGSGGLTFNGPGRLTLDADNTYAGATTVAAGTLVLARQKAIEGSSGLTIASGATLDVSGLGSGFTLGNGQSLGGAGSILGNVVFGAGSKFAFTSDLVQQLTLVTGSASFASSFGIGDVLGLDESTALGTYTLLAGTVDFTNIIDVGFGNAQPIGGEKWAYFEEGSLQLVIVPEPGTLALTGLGLAAAIWVVRRRR